MFEAHEPDDLSELRAEAAAQRRAARQHCHCNSASEEPCAHCQRRGDEPSVSESFVDLCCNVLAQTHQTQRLLASGNEDAAYAAMLNAYRLIVEEFPAIGDCQA